MIDRIEESSSTTRLGGLFLQPANVKRIQDNMAGVIVGKIASIELLLVGLLAEGHVLLEDVPGVGKTLMAKSLAKSIGGSFNRIQFTPDLLPADITGFNVYNPQLNQFAFQEGPVMTHVLLADEINRTIPRTQSSLLESMEEKQVTVDGVTMPLPRPFFVIATQNPIETEGTFPLPESQLDRFLLCVKPGYSSIEEETLILERFQTEDPLDRLKPVVTLEEVLALQKHRSRVHVSPSVREYIVTLVGATRTASQLRLGASPRASLNLMRAAQALAFIRERDYVLPDDVKYLAGAVLEHRLILDTREQIRGLTRENVLEQIIAEVPVPIGEAPAYGE